METGRITKWDDAKGFGFIMPHGGGKTVFFHITAIRPLIRRPQGGETVSFVRETDENGRTRAARVAFVGVQIEDPAFQIAHWTWIVPLTTLVIVVLLAIVGVLHFAVPVAFLAFSCLSFCAYWLDKYRAQHNDWRISEGTLHLFDLLGGWPGGLLAQHLFRHKVSKETFRVGFWSIVVINLVLVTIFTVLTHAKRPEFWLELGP